MEDNIPRVCNNCGVSDVTLKDCSKCKTVSYCSKWCQKTDWNLRHKRSCSLYNAKADDQQPKPQSKHLAINEKEKKNVGLKECSNCGGHDLLLSFCSRCQKSSYCSKVCQVQHWNEGHKVFCIPSEQRLKEGILKSENDVGDKCMICQASLISGPETILRCSHVFHIACIEDLIKFNRNCPICRSSLADPEEVSLLAEKVKNIYAKFLEQGYKDKNFKAYMSFIGLDWTGQETRQEKLSLEHFCENYPFLTIADPDFNFMSGVHLFLRGEYKEATIFLLKQLKQNKSDRMCKIFLALCYEILRSLSNK